jgi:undecaprenyl-diphosphatase
VGAIAWTFVAAFGLVRNLYHYPLDTLGAVGVAVAVVPGAALAIDALANRRPARAA